MVKRRQRRGDPRCPSRAECPCRSAPPPARPAHPGWSSGRAPLPPPWANTPPGARRCCGPAATFRTGSFTAKSPVTCTLILVSALSPLFVTVTCCAALVVPIVCAAKVSDGRAQRIGRAGLPVPAQQCGLRAGIVCRHQAARCRARSLRREDHPHRAARIHRQRRAAGVRRDGERPADAQAASARRASGLYSQR